MVQPREGLMPILSVIKKLNPHVKKNYHDLKTGQLLKPYVYFYLR